MQKGGISFIYGSFRTWKYNPKKNKKEEKKKEKDSWINRCCDMMRLLKNRKWVVELSWIRFYVGGIK
jgi:hypothetical protein